MRIPFYAIKKDFEIIFEWLSQEEEIAFIVSDGPGRWKAVSRYTFQGDQVYTLWHIPSGPLPFFRRDKPDVEDYVTDPWSGWKDTEEDELEAPFFGPAAIGILTLSARCRSTKKSPEYGLFMPGIGLSIFGWTGNHYAVIGMPALESTTKFWAKLKRWVQKEAVKIPREGPIEGPKSENWAFPHALEKIKKGYARNWM